jgi:hypothetical protein
MIKYYLNSPIIDHIYQLWCVEFIKIFIEDNFGYGVVERVFGEDFNYSQVLTLYPKTDLSESILYGFRGRDHIYSYYISIGYIGSWDKGGTYVQYGGSIFKYFRDIYDCTNESIQQAINQIYKQKVK